jgi:antitoxin component YwqK of YwqJK toxin-antitoxin module
MYSYQRKTAEKAINQVFVEDITNSNKNGLIENGLINVTIQNQKHLIWVEEVNDEKNEFFIREYDNGVLHKEFLFSNDELTLLKRYDENGLIGFERTIIDGKKSKTIINSNGKLKYETIALDENTTIEKRYFDIGGLAQETLIIKGEINCETHYHENTNLSCEKKFNNGKPYSNKQYDENNNLIEKTNYKNGNPFIRIRYDEVGRIISEEIFDEEYVFDNFASTYKEVKKKEIKEYNEDGILIYHDVFLDNDISFRRAYSDNGILLSEIKFYDKYFIDEVEFTDVIIYKFYNDFGILTRKKIEWSDFYHLHIFDNQGKIVVDDFIEIQ